MNAYLLVFTTLALLSRPGWAVGFALSDIENWTGSGSNQAALVIDWHDGKTAESLAWGFRWNGTATGLQMLQAIDAADPRLSVSYTSGGAFVFSMGYDLNGNGGTFTPGSPGQETGNASDPGDHYAEGVFTKFWGYETSAADPYGGGGTWVEASAGAHARQLTNGAWDGWSLSFDEVNFTIPDPGFPTAAMAVPEAGSAWAIAWGATVLYRERRRRR